MPKKPRILTIYIEFKDGYIKEEDYPIKEALETFNYYVRIALEIGLPKVRSIRIGNSLHIMYEYRDIRSISNQFNMFNYESEKFKLTLKFEKNEQK